MEEEARKEKKKKESSSLGCRIEKTGDRFSKGLLPTTKHELAPIYFFSLLFFARGCLTFFGIASFTSPSLPPSLLHLPPSLPPSPPSLPPSPLSLFEFCAVCSCQTCPPAEAGILSFSIIVVMRTYVYVKTGQFWQSWAGRGGGREEEEDEKRPL